MVSVDGPFSLVTFILSCVVLQPISSYYQLTNNTTHVCSLHASLHVYFPIQATTSKLKSQITILEAGLRGTREKRAAMKEHEAKLTSQFQVCLCC